MYNWKFSRFKSLFLARLALEQGSGRFSHSWMAREKENGKKQEIFFIHSMRFHMYAVIKTGGKQYKVAAGEKLKVEQIPADIGSQITLDQVLAVGAGDTVKFGAPLVEGATVLVTVIAQGRHDKVKIFKMRRRKHYQKRQGHRQNYTELQIVSINA
ncbi:ribosomal protein L21 [Herbaspirillum sp. Sphag1AN]|nr:ribosomal protein L21 [Herbaspirillum sp. Sphag1AN]MBB3246951.1 ribosomal protein L21 [Herbaspirillum sp. Sphag64]